jgi:hypothetical protein
MCLPSAGRVDDWCDPTTDARGGSCKSLRDGFSTYTTSEGEHRRKERDADKEPLIWKARRQQLVAT